MSLEAVAKHAKKKKILFRIKYFPTLKYTSFLVYFCKFTLRLNAINPQKYSVNYRVCIVTCSVLGGAKYGNFTSVGGKHNRGFG